VEKRYTSLTDTENVVLLITVREKPPAKSKFMFIPILSINDEYGFTYGGRITAMDLLGAGERLSVPLSWGGIRQAALESQFDVPGRIINSVYAGGGANWKKNPHYDIADFRNEVWGKVARRVKRLQFDFDTGWCSVDFGAEHQHYVTYGAGVALDTRQNLVLPRNAVYAGAGWERLSLLGGKPDLNRFKLDLRGYKGLFGQTVLAGQTMWYLATNSLPDYQKPFLGGAATLRGYEPGEFAGDNLFISSVELRAPLTSPRSFFRAGVGLFLDAGTVYDHGQSIGGADFRYGTGLGFFAFLAGFGLKVDVGYDLHDSFHVHFSSAFRF
jgi:outer membrane protein assembly factor BamA